MSWISQLVNLTGPGTIFGRSGAVIPLPGDYAASEVDTSGSTPWSDVAGAIDILLVAGGNTTLQSFHGRTGNVNGQSGDYSASQVTNDSNVTGSTVADAVDAVHARMERVEVSAALTGSGGPTGFSITGFSGADLVTLTATTAVDLQLASLPTSPARKRKTIRNGDDTQSLQFSHMFAGSANIRCPGGTTLTIAPGESVDCYYTDGGLWYLQPGAA